MLSTSAGLISLSFQRPRSSSPRPHPRAICDASAPTTSARLACAGAREPLHEATLDLADQRGAFEHQRRVKLQKARAGRRSSSMPLPGNRCRRRRRAAGDRRGANEPRQACVSTRQRADDPTSRLLRAQARSSLSEAGRVKVVLATTSPSMPRASTTATISSSSESDRSGAIFTRSGVRFSCAASAWARASSARATRSSSASLPCNPRKPGVLGEETLMVMKAQSRASAAMHDGVITGAIGRELVRPDVHPDDAGGAAPRGKLRRDRLDARAVQPITVDHGFIGRQAEKARPRISRLRQRRHAADLDEAEAEPKTSVDRLTILVETGRKPDRIREGEAEGLRRKPCVLGGAVPLAAADARPRSRDDARAPHRARRERA